MNVIFFSILPGMPENAVKIGLDLASATADLLQAVQGQASRVADSSEPPAALQQPRQRALSLSGFARSHVANVAEGACLRCHGEEAVHVRRRFPPSAEDEALHRLKGAQVSLQRARSPGRRAA